MKRPVTSAAMVFWGAVGALAVILVVYACGAGIVSGAASATPLADAPDRAAAGILSPAGRSHCSSARKGFLWYRWHAARWYRQMGARSRGVTAPLPRSCYELRYAARRERIRARIARINFLHWMDETYRRWECVHRNEGAWNDDGAPYYGGLQFDWNYMAAYGPGFLRKWGHAGRWPVWAQLIAAERGRQARGWHPWPNTARECGLL